MAAQRSALLLCILYLLCGAELCSSCFTCLRTAAERASICRYAQSMEKMDGVECLEKIRKGFKPLENIPLPFTEINKIRAHLGGFNITVREIRPSLSAKDWTAAFDLMIKDYIKDVKSIAAKNPAERCVPRCGIQKAARVFRCDECTVQDCNAAVECPLEDIYAKERELTNILCVPPFTLPSTITVTWMLARNLRVADISYCTTIYTGEDVHILINPTRKYHEGTYACQVRDADDDVIAEMFYFLNVTRSKAIEYSELEDAFNEVVNSEFNPEEEQEPEQPPLRTSIEDMIKHKILTSTKFCVILTIALALVIMVLTILCVHLCSHATNVEDPDDV
ncbi:sperm acrosome membrane-associated protein 6-like [Pseudophryne corroboree]|uniref:sperm acrosome membrane-associated protein 6-like n=1 Tax=Pseudophryne corroboree TaxID=495146 RepID=UPI0030815DC9